MSERVVIFIQRGSFEAAYQTASLAVTAAAMGQSVHVVFAFDALRALVAGQFGQAATPLERGECERGSAMGLPPPMTLLAEARALGARLLACDTTVRLCGLPEDAVHALDEVLGLPSIWRLSEGARTLTF